MTGGNEAPEEFPNVLCTVSYEDRASCQGPADRVSGHDPVEAPHPLSPEYKEEVS